MFNVDENKKNEIYINLSRIKKWPLILSYGLPLIAVIFTVVFLIYGYSLKDTFLVHDITASDFGQKNTLLIWTIVIAVDLILGFLMFIWKLVKFGAVGRNLMDRYNESLEVSNGIIIYGYQNMGQSSDKDRVEVKIPIKDIKSVDFDKKTEEMIIKGKICSMYYEDYFRKTTRAKEEYKDKEFVLYDIFKPSLERYLKNIGVKFN